MRTSGRVFEFIRGGATPRAFSEVPAAGAAGHISPGLCIAVLQMPGHLEALAHAAVVALGNGSGEGLLCLCVVAAVALCTAVLHI